MFALNLTKKYFPTRNHKYFSTTNNIRSTIVPEEKDSYVISYPIPSHKSYTFVEIEQKGFVPLHILFHDFDQSFELKYWGMKSHYLTHFNTRKISEVPCHRHKIISKLEELYNRERRIPIQWTKIDDQCESTIPDIAHIYNSPIHYSRSSDYVVMMIDWPDHLIDFDTSEDRATIALRKSKHETFIHHLRKLKLVKPSYPDCLIHNFYRDAPITMNKYDIKDQIYLYGQNDGDKFLIKRVYDDIQNIPKPEK
jgi:hypothetical protein